MNVEQLNALIDFIWKASFAATAKGEYRVKKHDPRYKAREAELKLYEVFNLKTNKKLKHWTD